MDAVDEYVLRELLSFSENRKRLMSDNDGDNELVQYITEVLGKLIEPNSHLQDDDSNPSEPEEPRDSLVCADEIRNISLPDLSSNNYSSIGGGNYGTVYLSSVKIGGKDEQVALKKVDDSSSFDREVDTLKQVDLLFIVHFFGISCVNRYIVMEYCQMNLKDFVQPSEDIRRSFKDTVFMQARSPSVDRSILGQLAVALGYLHSKDIKHGDMKQDNALLKEVDGRCIVVKLADFGFSRQLQPGQGRFDKTTNKGTLGFIAPELNNGESPSFASDVWALGVVIFFVLSKGEHPYQLPGQETDVFGIDFLSESLKSVLNMKSLREQWAAVDLIYRLLQHDPSNRPSVFLVLYHPFFTLTNENATTHFASRVSDFCARCPILEMKSFAQCFEESEIRIWYSRLEHQFQADEDPQILEDIAEMLGLSENLKLPDPSEMMAPAKCDIGSQLFFASLPVNSIKSKILLADKVKNAPPYVISQLTSSIRQLLLDLLKLGAQLFLPYLWTSLAGLKLDNKTWALYFMVNDYEFIMVNNSVDDFRSILEHSKRIINHNFRASSRNNQTLNWACSYVASIDVVRLVLEHGADPKLKDSTGRVPIQHIAEKGNNPEILSLLVQHGADVHFVDREGNNLLHWAANNHQSEITKWLLDQGVDPVVKNKNGVEPIHLAVRHNQNEDIARHLLNHGASANSKDKDDNNALHWAACCNTENGMIELLLEREVDINWRNRNGESPSLCRC